MINITEDHFDGHGCCITINVMPTYVLERLMGEDESIPNEGPRVRFRLYDDDGELYYSGTLTDDGECLNQVAALRWGEADSGCTTIKVERNGAWEQEIG